MKVVVGKVIVVGDQNVGKTSIVLRYVQNVFQEVTQPTIGAIFTPCKLQMHDDILVKLNIWDTAGQERFKALTPLFYRNANAGLLAFDLTRVESFENLKMWAHELRRNVEEKMVLCVVATKLDLVEQRAVSRNEGFQFANSLDAAYYETSAKEDSGVGQIFEHIAQGLLKSCAQGEINTMKIYEGDADALMARSSQLQATDIGWIEEPGGSITAIAHGEVHQKCCY
ncbi:uncharacterized protein [Atheta coriaria]|uniref:uncharacterized protein n=1 Tax=Dalotia coriaria TaxID=877792 RepID=UPI0031F353DD